MSFNLDFILQQTSRRQPAHDALVGPRPSDRLSYRQLDEAISRAAESLKRLGVRAGSCVGLHFASGPEYIILNYAIWRCAACVVPIPIELRSSEKHGIARRIHLDFIVSQRRHVGELKSLFAVPPAEIGTDILAGPALVMCEAPEGLVNINSAFIRFTSGTTAVSKGIILSHETIYDRIHAANRVLNISPDDRILWVLSMSHHFAVSIVSYLSFGAAIVLPPNGFAPAMLDAARHHGATMLYASPIHFQWLADCEMARGIPSLRLAICTTAPLDLATAEKFQNRFRLPAAQALGVIEVGLPFINTDFAETKHASVGRILPDFELRMQDLGLGAMDQEVLLRGKGMLDAYYEPWQSRDEVMRDGWFHTGDIGRMDDDGCLFLHGRKKELISVMGLKFFPQEVEAVLKTHPRVEQASVFSRPHARFGDVACARVVARDAVIHGDLAHELYAHCRERLAEYKVPEHIEFVPEIPTTANGKIVRRKPR